MSYEFNPDSPIFEFPNPYKVENLALLFAGAMLLLAGTATLLMLRADLAHGASGRVAAAVAIAVALLIIGIFLLARAFTQLRYFFGRNRPGNLAAAVAQDRDGDSQQAKLYKETLRQNAITFQEPSGALNGLLYSWLPQLIFAPRVIQRSAQTQFNNFLALSATFVSFLVCWLMFGGGPAKEWIGLAYGAFAFVQIMRPMVAGPQVRTGALTEAANVGVGSLVVLVLLAVLGPVVLGLAAPHLPDLAGMAANGIVCIAMVCVLLGCAVFGLALKNQLQAPPQAVGAARVAETLTMNAHPNKLVEELDRFLLSRWFNNIPNRRYSRRSPVIEGRQGQFTAEMFEETQPRPLPQRIATGLGHALSMQHFFWLTCLTGLATAYLLAGTVAALVGAQRLLAAAPAFTMIALAVSQFAIGLFCYRAAHVLWGRFDFVSELIWVDIVGSFESADLHIGNQFSGNVQTSKSVINVEAMTMRVWVSEIDTVIFGKDAQRQLIGMRGLPALAEELAATLKGFGETRSMVVAPTSSPDVERAQQIGALNQRMAKPPAAPGNPFDLLADAVGKAALGPASASPPPPLPQQVQGQRYCTRCGAGVAAGARFCGQCGAAMTT